MIRRASSMVKTTEADGVTDPQWLGTIGHVSALQYSYTCPGGAAQMSCTLQREPTYRPSALDPGRRVFVYRGARCVWEGRANEPVDSATGWAVAAHGIGTEGTDYAAVYTTWSLNDPVNQAISRGLRWRNPGIAGGWLAQQPDSGSQTVTDHLNTLTTYSAQVWMVDRWNTLQVYAIPTVVNRLLVCTTPVTRTIASDVTTIWLKYEASDDGQGNTSYGLTDAFNQDAINRHGATEVYGDLSNAGVMSAPSASNVGDQVLAKYQRAPFSGPFTARYGQLMTTGGSPIDLGCDRAGTVVRLLVTDAPFGGDAVTGQITFVVGTYEYNDDDGTATITPMASPRADFSSLLALVSPQSS